MMQWIVSSSVLILVVIALRYVLRGKLSLRMQYALWLLVLVRLLVPVSFGASDLSVMNAVPERAPTVQQGTYKQDIVGERNDAPANAGTVGIPAQSMNEAAPPNLVQNVTTANAGTVGIPAQSMNEAAPPNLVQNVTTATVTAPTVEKTDWARIAKTVWLAGAAALGLVFLAVNLRFGKKLRRSRERVEETDACLPVYESGETDTPCLFGVAKPSIYVTPDTRTEAETLRYALAHEQTHYRHGDNLWAVLRGVCLALHWYNPLVWWAAELSRRDAELACDEATIRRIGESERAAYGRTLIRMTCEKRPALLVTATMMTDSGKGLKERISLLVKKPKTAAYTAVAVLLIAGLSVACTFTGGKDNAELAEPFGKHYVEEATVACAPGYMNAPIGGEMEVVADRDSDDVRTLLLKRMDNEEEQLYETVAEVTLTKEEFDVRFNSKTDGPTEWLVDGLSAAKLRRENAKAWLCTSSTADENGWANRVYFLQQKDGTLYLVMAAEQPENQNRNFVCWVFRLTEKPVPTYDSMEAYALSVINALKQPNGYTYYILPDGAQSSADGTPIEVTEAAADVRVTKLEKRGDCTDLAPDGVLELWSFNYEVKPEDKAGALPDRFFWVGGNNITDDGYISDGFYYYLTVLRTNGEPGVYKLLDSRMANDGLWYNGCSYTSAYEYLYDFYADYASLDVPRCLITDFLNADDLIRENVVTSSDDCTARRYDGNGWYLYVPTVAVEKTIGQDSWYSAYCDGSTLCVDKSYDSVETMEDFYRDNGFTLEQYREGAALSGPWLRYDAESGTQFANYLAPNPDYGGCYIISAYWKPTDDTSVNEWGYSTRNRILNEAVKLRAMAQSFVVSGNAGSMVSTFQNDLDLAAEGKAAWLYLVENGETVGSYSVRGAWNVPTLNAYHYSTCDAPENTDRQLILWLSDNDNSYFSLNKNTGTQQPGFTPHNKTSYLGFYEGTNIVAYHRSMTDPVYYYEAQGDFGIIDNDGRTLYDRMLQWYDEAEFSTLCDEVDETAIPNRGQSWEEAAQEYLDAYEGAHLKARSGSLFKYTWVKNLVEPAEETMQTFRERGELDENGYCFYSTTEFVPESEWALGFAMAGNTGDCDDPDAPEGAYEYSRCCIITLKEDGWHGEVRGTGW